MRGGASETLVVASLGAIVCMLALYPIAWLAYGSFSTAAPFSLEEGRLTLANYTRAYADPLLWRTTRLTLVFALAQTAVGVAIGTALAWVCARTDAPGRRIFEFLVLVLFLMPLLLAVVAWTLLLSPQRGLLNAAAVTLFGLTQPPFDIYSLGGMILVQGLYLVPLAFLMVAPAFEQIDASLEKSARMSGAGPLAVLVRVTLPLVRPAILSAAVLLFIVGLESFDVPQMLGATKGLYTFTSLIYYQILDRYPPDYGGGTALAATLLAASAACMWAYRRLTGAQHRFETVKGKSTRAARFELGRWRWVASGLCWLFFAVAVFLPFAVLALGSLLPFVGRLDATVFSRLTLANYARVLGHPAIGQGLRNSLLLATFAAAAAVLLAATIGWVAVKSRAPGRRVLEALAMLPLSIPGTVLGLGLMWGYVGLPLPIYGTLLILAIAYVARYLPVALRTVAGGIVQLSDELDEAARMAGAGWIARFRRVVLPLLRPSLLAAWLLLFMIFFRELPMSILLADRNSQTISVVMYDFYQSGETGPLAALSVLMVVGIVALAWVVRRLFPRQSPTGRR